MKRGFTLVEIIVVIALIAIIGVGSVVAINLINDKKETNILIKNEPNFKNALEVYLTNHPEVVNNVTNNVEGAIVSLELLKNEGLINNDLDIDYKDKYYVVTNAFLSYKDISENVVKEECDNSIGLGTIASWSKNNNTDNVLYFCPKKSTGGGEVLNKWTKEECEKTSNKNTLACTIIANAEENTKKLIEEKGDNAINSIQDISYGTLYKEVPLSSSNENIKLDDSVSFNSTTNKFVSASSYENKYKKNEENINGVILEKTYKVSKLNNSKICYGTDYKIVDQNDVSNYNLKYKELTNGGGSSGNYKYPFFLKNKTCLEVPSDKDWKSEEDLKLIKETLVGKYVYISKDLIEDDLSGNFVCKTDCFNYSLDYVAKIEEVSYVLSGYNYNDSTITLKFSLIFPELKRIERTLSKIKDDYGDSYYYRGNVNDNYVNYAGMCFRIVRINGDGSTKLILDDAHSTCNGNNYTGNYIYDSYNGITYQGSEDIDEAVNYKDFQFFPTYRYSTGNAEYLSNKLKHFQNQKLNKIIPGNNDKNYLDYLKYGDWCYADYLDIDTDRNTKLDITELKCSTINIKQNYFDKDTKMFIGTLLAEEVALSGATDSTSKNKKYTYLVNPFSKSYEKVGKTATWITFTPSYMSERWSNIYTVDVSGYIGEDYLSHFYGNNYSAIKSNYRPAINLIRDIKISRGNGTRMNPYEIDFS